MVDVGFVGDQAWFLDVSDQAHGLPGNTQTALAFRANGNKLEELAQRLGDVTIVFVAAVETDLLPEKAGRDPDANLVGVVLGGGATVSVSERWYVRPTARFQVMSGLHVGALVAGKSVGIW